MLLPFYLPLIILVQLAPQGLPEQEDLLVSLEAQGLEALLAQQELQALMVRMDVLVFLGIAFLVPEALLVTTALMVMTALEALLVPKEVQENQVCLEETPLVARGMLVKSVLKDLVVPLEKDSLALKVQQVWPVKLVSLAKLV